MLLNVVTEGPVFVSLTCPVKHRISAGSEFRVQSIQALTLFLSGQEAGIAVKLAPTIGIAVDHRRHNRSLESLQVWSHMALVGCKRWSCGCC